MAEDENPPEPARERRLDELTERTADDVTELARAYAGVARNEAAEAGERALWPAAVAAAGGVLAVVGLGVLVASPAIPGQERRLKRRMRLYGAGYLVLGAAATIAGVLVLGSEVQGALPRTRRGLRELVDAFRGRV